MKVRFYFKNGKEIEIKCEDIEITTSIIDGSITGYKILGMDDIKLQFINMREIIAVTIE